ncbi:MAG: DegV family protein [Lachnospiraceae bacterium]|nr:DegV family protein [Lachnospiraceae bacterium]MEE3377814.1 DegV family protein [Lachnospiraceae bacterium]MEE3456748.1 DegV family protein [Lachnospiraceae bacterium]
MKYRVVMDSAGEFTESQKGREEFVLVPLTLMIGDETIIDDGTLDQLEIVKKIAASPTCPKTACPSPEAYREAFDCGAEHIYGVTISGNLSGSYQSAVIGRDMYLEDHPDAKIHVFDSCSTSVGETILVMKIEELEAKGVPFEEIVREVEALRDEKSTTFVLDNLETLRKNGRLSRMKALAAQILKIKPICAGTLEGEIVQIDQARGINKALVKMVQHVAEKTRNPENKILAISFVNCRERAVMVRDALLERMHVREVLLMETGGLSTVYANDGGIIVVI